MGETWAGIVRVSHVGTRSGDSFHADEDQVSDINRYAATRNAQVVFMPPELSVSGGKAIRDRPSLEAAILGVERGEFQGIVVAYLSRLTRSRSGIEIWDRVEAAGGHVHCAAEALDTSTPSGRFVRDIHLANAVREREEHSDRHAKRREKTVQAGVWRQHQVPRGYRFAGPAVDGKFRGQARKLVPDEVEADRVRGAFRDRVAGRALVRIADDLGMTASGVRALLANRVYLGELRDGEHVNPAAHEPLVSVGVFEAAQARGVRPARRTGREPALLAGIIRCSGCGHLMTRGSGAGGSYYACPVRHSGERCPEPATIRTDLIDSLVAGIARRELARVVATGIDDGAGEQAQTVLDAAEREMVAYVETVRVDVVGAQAFAAGVERRRAAIDDARRVLGEIVARQITRPVVVGDVGWDELNGHERNHVLRGLLSVVIVRRAGGRGRRVPVVDRVRVLAWDAGVVLPERVRGRPLGIRPLGFPDLGGPGVLGMPGPQDVG